MRVRQSLRTGVGFIALIAMLLVPFVQTNQPASIAWAQSSDPPARVGRLNYISGPVSVAPGGLNQWANATLNYPLTTGTALWTDANGRAELHIGSTAIRMDQTTELDILNLDDQTTQLRIAQGTVDIGLRQLGADERFEVATPSASITLVRPGHYRFLADANGVQVTVWTGQVDVATSTNTFSVYAGQTVIVSDSGYQTVATPAQDEFGQWSLEREGWEEQALKVAPQYVPPTMTGYEDLVNYGTWRTEGGYGAVWFPAVQPGWAPYHSGHWVWVSPWGWTWVDYAPWGFAPFHYGRWVLIGGLWAWVPGPVYVRPVFAPALVVFLIIGDGIGWFPLAPQEVYVPPYYCSQGYRRSVNINIVNINITNINVTNIKYVFRHSPRAITLMRNGAFVNAQPAGTFISGQRGDLDRAKVVAGAPLQPEVRSLFGNSQGTVGSHRPPAVVEQRPVVVRQAPPAPIRPQVAGVQPPVRSITVKPAAETRGVRPEPRPAPAQPVSPPVRQPVVPAPNPGQPGVPIPRPTGALQPAVPQQPAQPGPGVPTPHSVQPGAPAPNPAQPGVPVPRPDGALQPAVPPQPAQPGPGVPTPHSVQPGAPAPNPVQPGLPAPRTRPITQPPQPVMPQPNPAQPGIPTPHPVQPVAPAPIPPQPRTPAPQPRPQPVQPAVPGPNPLPAPRPVMPVPNPAPAPRPAQPVIPVPRPQPVAPAPRPAPAQPNGVSMPPQNHPAPQVPRPQVRAPVCDVHSPNYDARQCSPSGPPKRH